MTIRLEEKKNKRSRRSGSDILSDPEVKSIIENMTAKHSQILKDFKEDRLHPLPCICWLCLWRRFEKKRPVGPPYDYLTFLAYHILSEIMSEWQYEPVKKIPIRRIAKEVIRQLPIIDHETKKVLNEFSREMFEAHFIEYTYKKRYQADKLLNTIDQLIHEIYHEWKKNKPEPIAVIDLKRPAPALLASKIAKFVYSQPNRRATSRQIQRHTNKRKADIEALHGYLEWRYGIIVPPHEKWESTIYVGTLDRPKSSIELMESLIKD